MVYDDRVDPPRRRTLCIEADTFSSFASETSDWGWSSWSLAAGTVVVPVKARLGGGGRDFDFSTDVQLGTNAGVRWRLNPDRDLYGSVVVGAGISSVQLDSLNTRGAVSVTTDRSAFSLNTGLVFEIEGFQFGTFLGWDFISQPNQTDWMYHGRSWLSLGLGYNILSAKREDTPQRSQRARRR